MAVYCKGKKIANTKIEDYYVLKDFVSKRNLSYLFAFQDADVVQSGLFFIVPYISEATTISGMFYNCQGLQSIDLSSFNTSNVTDMNNMFYYCQGLQSIDLSSFNTSNVTNMSYMFYNCQGLQSIDLSSFNTSNVTNMNSMFGSCQGLQSIDLSSFDTSNVTDMYNMFYNCQGLQSIDLSSFDTSNVTNMESMFGGLYGLKILKAGKAGTCKQYLDLYYSSKLTNESVISVANWLYDYSGGSSHTLELNSTTKTNIADQYVKPSNVQGVYEACDSSDEGAILLTTYINNKNWSIA